MSISERLQKELKARTPVLTKRKFQKAVEAEAGKGTKGTSYASVYEYVQGKGKTEPPLSFLRPAAEVLGIRLEWLITGDGLRTEAEQLVEAKDVSIEKAAAQVYEAGTGVSRDMFFKLLARLLLSCPDCKESGSQKVGLLAHRLQERVLGVYRAFNPSGFEAQVRQNDHFEAMLHAMSLAVPDPGQGVPIKKLLKNLEGRKTDA